MGDIRLHGICLSHEPDEQVLWLRMGNFLTESAVY